MSWINSVGEVTLRDQALELSLRRRGPTPVLVTKKMRTAPHEAICCVKCGQPMPAGDVGLFGPCCR